MPVWALGSYGDANIAFAVVRVTLFLKYAEEVVAFIFPSTVYMDGVLGY
jgi:hypothetical protein